MGYFLCVFMYVHIFNDGNFLEQVIEELALRMLFEEIFTFWIAKSIKDYPGKFTKNEIGLLWN